MWMHRTRASTPCSLMSCVSFTSLTLSLHRWDTQGTSEHTVLTCVLCVLISASLDAQNTGEHISARPCPCFSLFDTTRMHRTRVSTPCSLVSCVSLSRFLWMPRTWASTLVLARVLYVHNPVPHRRDTQDTSEHQHSLVSCVLILLSLDAQNTGEHISAHPCPVRL